MKIRILTSVLAFLAVLPVSAQWRYDRILRRNLWNDGANIAGIRTDTTGISLAGMSASYQGGDLMTMSQSSSEWSAGAMAKSVKHLEGYSMKGSFSFRNTEAQDMCGSMFLDPGFFPVNVYEFTPGRKTFQNYGMDGGIAVDMGKSWTIGTGLDFGARNVAKRKDLRYSTYRLDMTVNPSVLYTAERFRLGGTFIFTRNTETINAEQTGTATVAPFVFFDEGLALGNWQVWTGNGSRLKENGVNGLPVRQNSIGGEIQFASARESFYAHAGLQWKTGTVGERQVIWYRYGGPVADLHVGLRRDNSVLRAGLSWHYLRNMETVQDKVTEGGISQVYEYGSNEILRSSAYDCSLEYEYTSRDLDAVLGAVFSDSRKIAAPMYPYVFSRELCTASLNGRLYYRVGRFEYGANALVTKGFDSCADKKASNAAVVSAPYRHEAVWNDMRSFETAGRLASMLSVDWNFTSGFHALLQAGGVWSWDTGKTRYCITTGLNYYF